MNEDEAKAWCRARFGAEVVTQLMRLVDLVVEENSRQNLISPASVAQIWSRHVVDSLQLIYLAQDGTWLDVGTGGGFPGLAMAVVRAAPMHLVEPRRRRADFLLHCQDELRLEHVRVSTTKVERIDGRYDVISARAVSGIENILQATRQCATPSTRWLLPRGRVDQEELRHAAQRYTLMFHVEQSITEPESSIVVLRTS